MCEICVLVAQGLMRSLRSEQLHARDLRYAPPVTGCAINGAKTVLPFM